MTISLGVYIVSCGTPQGHNIEIARETNTHIERERKREMREREKSETKSALVQCADARQIKFMLYGLLLCPPGVKFLVVLCVYVVVEGLYHAEPVDATS